MAAVSDIDKRMLQKGAYIQDGKVLLQIEEAKWLGKVPNRRLVVRAVDCASPIDAETPLRKILTGQDMLKFQWVQPCVDAEEKPGLVTA